MYYKIKYYLNICVLNEKAVNKWLLATKKHFRGALLHHAGAALLNVNRINLSVKDDTLVVFIEATKELSDDEKVNLKQSLLKVINNNSAYGNAFITLCSFNYSVIKNNVFNKRKLAYYAPFVDRSGIVNIRFNDMQNRDSRIYREPDSYGLDGSPEYNLR